MQPLPASSLSYLGCYGLPKKALAQASRCFQDGNQPLKTGYTEDAAGRASNSLTPAAVRFTLPAALELGCTNAMPEHLHPLYEEPLSILVRCLVDRACGKDAQAWASLAGRHAADVNDRLQAAWFQAGRLDVHPRDAWIAAAAVFARMRALIESGWMPGHLDQRSPENGRRTTPQCLRDATLQVRAELDDDVLYANALWGTHAILEDINGIPDLGSLGREMPFTPTNSLDIADAARARAIRRADQYPRRAGAQADSRLRDTRTKDPS